jgi:DNA modification methylase
MKKNYIHHGDNLKFLKSLDSEIFDLIYIDPQYFTQHDFRDFKDTWKDMNDYLSFMIPRLKEIHRVLKKTGCLYIECDICASHYLKIELDKIFGYNNLISEIYWERIKTNKTIKNSFGNNIDNIFLYSKSKNYTFNPTLIPLTEDQIKRDYKSVEKQTGRKFSTCGMTWIIEKCPTDTLYFKDIGKSITLPKGKGFKWSQHYLDEKLKNNPHILHWTKGKKQYPRYKIYLDENQGNMLKNLWNDINPVSANKTQYNTQKPEKLLERIIHTSSNKGDLVGDFWCGSGTTCVVAKRMKRNYIGCDVNIDAITLTKKRLKNEIVYESLFDCV